MGLKISEAWARRLNNDVGDHVATRQTHRRFWQRVCGSIERRLSLVSFFGENLAAAAFGTFANTIGTKRTCRPRCATSAFRGKAENICSHRAFPVLTQKRHAALRRVHGYDNVLAKGKG